MPATYVGVEVLDLAVDAHGFLGSASLSVEFDLDCESSAVFFGGRSRWRSWRRDGEGRRHRPVVLL